MDVPGQDIDVVAGVRFLDVTGLVKLDKLLHSGDLLLRVASGVLGDPVALRSETLEDIQRGGQADGLLGHATISKHQGVILQLAGNGAAGLAAHGVQGQLDGAAGTQDRRQLVLGEELVAVLRLGDHLCGAVLVLQHGGHLVEVVAVSDDTERLDAPGLGDLGDEFRDTRSACILDEPLITGLLAPFDVVIDQLVGGAAVDGDGGRGEQV